MNALVILLLFGLWASVLLPGALRGRQHSPASSVDSFERSMSILSADLGGRSSGRGRPTSGRQVLVLADPRAFGNGTSARQRTLRRRRIALQALACSVAVLAVLAVVLGSPFVQLFLASLVALVGYLVLLVRLRAAAERARRTVRRLPVPAAPPGETGEPLAPERIASGQHG